MSTRPIVENTEYAAFARRIIRALGRRAGWDVEALPTLLELQREIDEHMRAAVEQCRADGYSWAEIAARLGPTRQAAQQRYGVKTGLTVTEPVRRTA